MVVHDPAGNTQGPFEASVMQQWHDVGFFTLDLRMKRTVMDREWTTVEEMMRRAGGGGPGGSFSTGMFGNGSPDPNAFWG
jgi:hypothetical protein